MSAQLQSAQSYCTQCKYKNQYRFKLLKCHIIQDVQVIAAISDLIAINSSFIPQLYQMNIGNQIDSLLLMNGQVNVNYQGNNLMIKTEIIFSKEFPISAPAFYFTNPNPELYQANQKYIANKRGTSNSYQVIFEYSNWNNHRDIKILMNQYIEILKKDFPLYSRQQGENNQVINQNNSNQNSYNSSNNKNILQQSNNNQNYNQQVIYSENKDIEDAVNKEIANIKETVNNDLNEMMNEVKQIQNHNLQLQTDSSILHRVDLDLDEQIQEVEKNVSLLRESQYYSQESLTIENLQKKYMRAQTTVHDQILQLVSELDALKETFLFLDEWFKAKKDFDSYIAQVRELAQKEFEFKLLLKKCQKLA